MRGFFGGACFFFHLLCSDDARATTTAAANAPFPPVARGDGRGGFAPSVAAPATTSFHASLAVLFRIIILSFERRKLRRRGGNRGEELPGNGGGGGGDDNGSDGKKKKGQREVGTPPPAPLRRRRKRAAVCCCCYCFSCSCFAAPALAPKKTSFLFLFRPNKKIFFFPLLNTPSLSSFFLSFSLDQKKTFSILIAGHRAGQRRQLHHPERVDVYEGAQGAAERRWR